ncbi:beta-lactamase-like protein [Thamnocephalis sphaerospora]|uniref:Beta-lactamase-like protein n=1 Tax=Thamnocephalis sphaerospora TaxID=78915 RepID=A0A4P9XY11_9FUNG|nr:beta-lactamase-like protein [Thamnocephalis sphaerospora]|eukprot:RKP10972.1 beta-lactamase-like protein [Thamnocephalis sphaerospora]
MTALTSLPNVKQLSERVIRVLGLNPGPFTLQGTNTYLVGKGHERILIDTGEGKEGYVALLQSALAENAPDDTPPTISRILLTHWHRDHVGGLDDVCRAFPALDKTASKYPDEERDGQEIVPVADDDVFHVNPGCTLRALHTPGHTRDHLAFYLEEEQALFTGDCVLGHGSTVFEDLPVYLASLERMRSLNAQRLYPGHGPVIDGAEQVRATLDQYVEHRMLREREVLGRMAACPLGEQTNDESAAPPVWTAAQLVGSIYQGYPDSVLNAAERGILLHLLKLKQDGRVRAVPDALQTASTPKMQSTEHVLSQTRLDLGDVASVRHVGWSLLNA